MKKLLTIFTLLLCITIASAQQLSSSVSSNQNTVIVKRDRKDTPFKKSPAIPIYGEYEVSNEGLHFSFPLEGTYFEVMVFNLSDNAVEVSGVFNSATDIFFPVVLESGEYQITIETGETIYSGSFDLNSL